MFGNYDGGKLNIVIDQNIPNLKIGICTYEPVIVTFSGPFVSNVVDVYYAGFNSSVNNNHCGFPISTSSFVGVNPALVTVDVVPPVNIISPPNPNNIAGLPNGNNVGVVTVVSCDTSTYQGGGNTIDQVVDVFQQRFGGSLRGLVVQYCCWLDVDFYRVSGVTGRCCNSINPGLASISYPSGPFCIGNGPIVPAILGDSSGTFVSDPPTLPINPVTGVVDLNNASPGTYVITYSVPFNCTPNVDTDTIVISSGSAIPPAFSFPNVLCQGAGPQAPQPLAGFVTGGTFSSSPAGLSINPSTGVINLSSSQSGTYTVSYTSPPGACGGNLTFTFPNLTVISPQLPYTIVAGDSCNLNALNVQLSGSVGVLSITWNMGDPNGGASNVFTGNTNVHQYSQPGTYTITAILQGLCGNDTIFRTIQIVAPTQPVTSFSYANDPCRMSNAQPSLAQGFSQGGIFSVSPSLPINPASGVLGNLSGFNGQFVVTYTFPSQACIAGAASSSSIQVQSQSNLLNVAPSRVSLALGDSVQLIATGLSAYTWQPVEGLSCSNCASPFASPEQTTLYLVSGIDVNGCPASDTILVSVDIKCNELFIPDIFSPDGRGPQSNESLCLFSNCVRLLNFFVFNRWGQQIFETNDIHNCWDGTFDGKEAPPGIYAYKVYLEQLDGKVISKTGTIMLTK
jgi:gliding motility-associated-like protein